MLAKEIQLKHKAPVLSIQVISLFKISPNFYVLHNTYIHIVSTP